MAEPQPLTALFYDKHYDKEYETKLLQYVQQMEHSNISDYSQGFSGTKMDTTIEASMAQLMRGGPADDNANDPFRAQKCVCQMADDGAHAANCTGRWLRTLNKQKTCYLYVRTITHEVTGIKPSGFYDPEEERRQALLVAAGEYPDFTSCFLENLEETMREVIRKHKQTPLLLTGSDELSAELVEWFGVTVGEDRTKKPVPRGYVLDTRPLALGQTRTGVKFEDSVKACKALLLNSVKNGRWAVVNVESKPPNFQDKVCGEAKYRDLFPMNVFDPKARGWRKDMLRFDPRSEDDAVTLLSTCTPGDYERELRVALDPMPWALLYPVHVQATPLVVTTTTDLLQVAVDCFAQRRVPLVMDATQNRDVVDLFWTVGVFGHSFVIDVPMAMYRMKGRTPTQDPQTHAAILEEWRQKLVNAMKQGYYLVIKMGTETPDMRAFCTDEVFPYAVFRGGEVQQEAVRTRLYQPDDLECGLAIVRDGFGVVVTSAVALDAFKRVLKASIPLRNLKGVAVM